ncbi:MAG: YcxB family protein [Anaerolineales bacterium]|jgi:hypothetical protein
MNVAIQLTKEDIVDAIHLELDRPFWLRLPEYLFYLTILAAILYILALILSGYTQFLLGAVLMPRRAYRSYESSSDLQTPAELTLSDDGLVFSTEFSHSQRKWNHIVGWKENDKLLLLYISDTNAHLIPLRALRNSKAYSFLKEKITQYDIPYRSYPNGTWMSFFLYLFFIIVLVMIIFT